MQLSGIFSIFTKVYNYHLDLIPEHFVTPKRNPLLDSSHSPLAGLALLSVSMYLPVWDMSHKWESSLLNVIFNCTREFYGKVHLIIGQAIPCFPLVFKNLLEIWKFQLS